MLGINVRSVKFAEIDTDDSMNDDHALLGKPSSVANLMPAVVCYTAGTITVFKSSARTPTCVLGTFSYDFVNLSDRTNTHLK